MGEIDDKTRNCRSKVREDGIVGKEKFSSASSTGNLQIAREKGYSYVCRNLQKRYLANWFKLEVYIPNLQKNFCGKSNRFLQKRQRISRRIRGVGKFLIIFEKC